MKTIVFDVAAESGGALTVLNQYYSDAMNDLRNDWIFVVSVPQLNSQPNIKVLRYPWIKKSWIHRLYFEIFIAHRLVNKYKADEVLSLQNVAIRHVKVKQTLYLHNALPFIEKRYHLTENYLYWVYQNVISRLIYKSIANSDIIVVQTKWMKDAVIKRLGISDAKLIIQQPKVNIQVKQKYSQGRNGLNTFFYPASAETHKNHEVILKACELLKSRNVLNYRILLTVTGYENRNIIKIREATESQKLPIDFIGKISIQEVFDLYSRTILIFPSYIETFGLPMLEAKMHESPILASDCEFSHEILDGYSNASFFEPTDYKKLSFLMEDMIDITF